MGFWVADGRPVRVHGSESALARRASARIPGSRKHYVRGFTCWPRQQLVPVRRRRRSSALGYGSDDEPEPAWERVKTVAAYRRPQGAGSPAGLDKAYMRSGTGTPSRSRPLVSTRNVSAQSASRRVRSVSGSAFSTGHSS
jgi:hypothetical protein